MFKQFIGAIELSFATIRRIPWVHIARYIARGNVTWLEPENVERLRLETLRFLVVGLVFQIVVEKTMLCKRHNKGTCTYEKQAEHTDKGITYQHFCINCFANTARKYDHPKLACLRLKNDNKGQTMQKV